MVTEQTWKMEKTITIFWSQNSRKTIDTEHEMIQDAEWVLMVRLIIEALVILSKIILFTCVNHNIIK